MRKGGRGCKSEGKCKCKSEGASAGDRNGIDFRKSRKFMSSNNHFRSRAVTKHISGESMSSMGNTRERELAR